MILDLGIFDWLAAFSYGLIALSYAMRNIRWLRTITIAACTLDIFIYYYIRPGQPMWVQMVMSILFIAINAYQLVVLWQESRVVRFDAESQRLYSSVFSLLTPGEFKRLLRIGSYASLNKGDMLLTKDVHPDAISVVVSGNLLVKLGDEALNHIQAGGFAGEMSYFTGLPASVDVQAATATRVFRIAPAEIERLRGAVPDLHTKITGILGRDVAEKLRQTTSVMVGQAHRIRVAEEDVAQVAHVPWRPR